MTKQIEQEIQTHLQKIKQADKWVVFFGALFLALVGALFA